MDQLIYVLYLFTIKLIRIYKWIELKILVSVTPILKTKATKLANSIGVVLHYPGGDRFKNKQHSLSSEENIAIKKSDGKYNKLVHIKVNDMTVFAKCANLGPLGIAETFLDRSWDCTGENIDDLSEFGRRMLENNFQCLYYTPWNKFLEWLEFHAFSLQTRKVVGKHYDLGNDFYEIMLDPLMQNSCGYWKNATSLNEAQVHNMELIAQKLDLRQGMRVLDIGCGWGTLCKYLAENYQVICVGVTISEEQVSYGKKICKGLPVDIRLQDYRDLNEKFDRIVSVETFEHVEHWNYTEYMQVVERCLVDDGIFLLQTVGRNHFSGSARSDPWVEKCIFPNGQIPSPGDITDSTKHLFIIEDWHNFGVDYAKTLYCWRENVITGWPEIVNKYGEDFYRMWICYMSFARSLFLSRRGQLWQIVFSKEGLRNGYTAVR